MWSGGGDKSFLPHHDYDCTADQANSAPRRRVAHQLLPSIKFVLQAEGSVGSLFGRHRGHQHVSNVDDGVEEIYTPSIQREMGIHTGLEEDEDEDDWESLSSGLEEYDDDDDESGEDGAEFLPFDGMGGGIYFD